VLDPGVPVEHVRLVHVEQRAPLGHHRLNACGYSLGATFAPNWMDCPMFYAGQRCNRSAAQYLSSSLADNVQSLLLAQTESD
jgi:hypothetical protein